VAQPVQTKGATLCVLPSRETLKRRFYPSVKNRARRVAGEMERFSYGRVGQGNSESGFVARSKESFPEIARLIVVGGAKADPRYDTEPAKIGVWIKVVDGRSRPATCHSSSKAGMRAKLRCRSAIPVSPHRKSGYRKSGSASHRAPLQADARLFRRNCSLGNG